MNTGVTFNLLMRQKKSFMEKMTRLILDKVIVLDRHMSNGQMYLFLQLFSKSKNVRLN